MVTNGWDTVYAIAFECLNQQLATRSLSFPNQLNFSDPSTPFTITATLGPWKASTSGSAQLLNILVPITSGTLNDQDKGTFDLTGISLSYDLSLQLLSQPNSLSLSPDIPTLTAVEITNPGSLSELQQVGLLDAVSALLTSNAAAINYAFASIDLGSQSGATWLTPKACNYTTFNNFLVILASLQSTDISQLQPIADATMIAPGNTAAMLISPGIFLEYGVMPTLPAQFGVPASPPPFQFTAQPQPTISTSTTLPLPEVKVGAVHYSPKLTGLQMTLSGGIITSIASVTCSLKLGMEASFTVTAIHTAGFNPATQSLEFVPEAKPTVTKSTHMPILDEILSGIFGAIVQAIIPIIASVIANSLGKALSGSNLSTLPADPITWAAAGKFNVSAAGIAQSVYFQGTWNQ